MGVYSPEEYFKKLYPGWFSETGLAEAISYVLIFTLLMLAFYFYIQYFEKRKYKIEDEIYCGKFIKDHTYDIKIIKLNGEWLAIKINTYTMERTNLKRGDLNKVIDYINRNFDLKCKYNNKDI